MNRPLCVMVVAAEASGDLLGAELIRALRARLGEGMRFVGVGGEAMTAEGVVSPFDIADLSILGLFEGLKALPRVNRRAAETAELARRERPDVAVLIDSWGFNLRVAHCLRAIDPKVVLVKYVAPQVWASRPGRAKTLATSVDLLISINSLDAGFFEPQGLPTVFVGNPALAREPVEADPARFRRSIGAGDDDPILLIAPGSRRSEIAHLAAPFQEAAHRLKAGRPELRFAIPVSSTVAKEIEAGATGWPEGTTFVSDPDLKRDATAAATLALACSGTVTTEIALAGVPMVVAYRVGVLTHALLHWLITAPYATLFNIAAGEEIAPEFLQYACTGPNLASALAARLNDPALRAEQVARQNAALLKMGRGLPDPAATAADAILAFMTKRAT